MSTIESNKRESSAKGTISNPYTEEEYQQLLAEGKEVACYVEGRGFCAPAAMAPPPNPGSPNDPSDPSDPEPEPSSEPSEPSVDYQFIICHVQAGEATPRPIGFPPVILLKVSWGEGLLQSINPTYSPTLSAEYVSEFVERADAEYICDLNQKIDTLRWDNNFTIYVAGTLIYSSLRDEHGRPTDYFVEHEVHYIESISIPDSYKTIIEES